MSREHFVGGRGEMLREKEKFDLAFNLCNFTSSWNTTVA
jgi:hypothetical protein